MSPPLPDPVAVLESLARRAARAVLVSTGGGSPAISHLLTTPGASRVVLECLVPYAHEAVDLWLGGPQETYCSSRTARRLAVMAWQRARTLGATAADAVGAAVTASLRTREPKRGEHRVFVAVQTLAGTSVAAVALTKDARSRADEEQFAAALLLDRLAALAGSTPVGPLPLLAGEAVSVERLDAPPDWRQLLAGDRAAVSADGSSAAPTAGLLVFPGSFDPLHEGHLRMAVIAQEIAERPIDFELSALNVDKPALDYLEMRTRADQFAGRQLWLTRAATFLEKLDVFPEGTFVMGADTFARLADPRFYGGSTEAADRAAQRIAGQARGLIVFGRERGGVFEDASLLDVPRPLRDVAYFVSPREFRMDISSTELRRRRETAE
jgi:nicotinic acid mononucleotide adenylyltransferase/nicotinamide mononucleotide (NMN) deamidase PncC